MDTKKTVIWEACMSEFAEKGYHRASTNAIAERAGVSKGLIFHYFGNKQKIYRGLVEEVLDQVERRVLSALPSGKSFMDTIMEISEVKMTVYREKPLYLSLLTQAFYNPPDFYREEMMQRYQQMMIRGRDIYRQILTALPLREGADSDRILDLLMAISGIIESKYSQLLQNPRVSSETVNQLKHDYTAYLKIILEGIQADKTTEGGTHG